MTITFSVNLEAQDRLYAPPVSGSRSNDDNLENTRSTWLPNHLRGNYKLNHDDTITATDYAALYLKNNYTTGDTAFLTIVSEGV